jgi:hypothetical protein
MEIGDTVLLNVKNGRLCSSSEIATHKVKCKIVAKMKGLSRDSIFIVPLINSKLNRDCFDTLFAKNQHLNLLENGSLDRNFYDKHMNDICIYLYSNDTAHFSVIDSDTNCRKG